MDGESYIARIVAFMDDARYDELMEVNAKCTLTEWGDITGERAPELHGKKR